METQTLRVMELARSPSSAAVYIATLAAELAKLARHNSLECLGYILDMARLEAEQVAKGAAHGGAAADGGGAGPNGEAPFD